MIWITGCNGMLGREISTLLEKNGVPFTGTGREVDICGNDALLFARKTSPDWIVNCAAYTAVDKAEDDAENARRLNVDGPAFLAEIASEVDAHLIHISTDYVFGATDIAGQVDVHHPYSEDAPTSPTGVYGTTKRAGELRVIELHKKSYIVRTAWLYGMHGANFVQTMIKLMSERAALRVVNDQHGTPTWAEDLSRAVLALVKAVESGKTVQCGIYHYTNEGITTWFEFAEEIQRLGQKCGLITGNCAVSPCTSAEYPAKAKRPLYSVLDKSKIKAALEIEIPCWQTSLERFLGYEGAMR